MNMMKVVGISLASKLFTSLFGGGGILHQQTPYRGGTRARQSRNVITRLTDDDTLLKKGQSGIKLERGAKNRTLTCKSGKPVGFKSHRHGK